MRTEQPSERVFQAGGYPEQTTCSRETETTTALNELSQAISLLQKATDELFGRLQRVSRPIGACKKEQETQCAYACQLAMDIKSQERRIHEISVAIEDITQVLEI